jgi:hypothetical protein
LSTENKFFGRFARNIFGYFTPPVGGFFSLVEAMSKSDLFTLVNVICVAITYCFQLTGQKKYSSFSKNLPLYTNEFRLLADFLIKTLPIVACFTEIALFLCINHEFFQEFLATITKKTLKTGVIP